MAKRFKIVRQIRKYKKINKLPLIDKKRENYILETKIRLAQRLKLDSDLIKNIFMLIFKKTKEKTNKKRLFRKNWCKVYTIFKSIKKRCIKLESIIRLILAIPILIK